MQNKRKFKLNTFYISLMPLLLASIPRFYLSLISGQPLLAFYYLLLVVFISVILYLCTKVRDIIAAPLLLMLLLFSYNYKTILNIFTLIKPSETLTSAKINSDFYLYEKIETEQDIKNKQYCFNVYTPSYIPILFANQSMEDYKLSGSTSPSKICENQIIELNYGPHITFIEVSQSYNFEYRKGIEGLSYLKNYIVLKGSQKLIGNSSIFYIDKPVGLKLYPIKEKGFDYEYALIDKGDTLIYAIYPISNEYHNFNNPDYAKMLESLYKVN